MHRLLTPENEVLIRNMTPSELSHYAILEMPEHIVVSGLAVVAVDTNQLELRLDETTAELDHAISRKEELEDDLADADALNAETKQAIGSFLASLQSDVNLKKLRELAA